MYSFFDVPRKQPFPKEHVSSNHIYSCDMFRESVSQFYAYHNRSPG